MIHIMRKQILYLHILHIVINFLSFYTKLFLSLKFAQKRVLKCRTKLHKKINIQNDIIRRTKFYSVHFSFSSYFKFLYIFSSFYKSENSHKSVFVLQGLLKMFDY